MKTYTLSLSEFDVEFMSNMEARYDGYYVGLKIDALFFIMIVKIVHFEI